MHRLLVIDDEPSIRKALTMGLSTSEMEVHSTADGISGVNLGCSEKYDVFIVDLYLPDINGLEVLQRVKKCLPGSVFIVITAHASQENALEALKSGANEYLEKPLDMKTLEEAIRRNLLKSGNGH